VFERIFETDVLAKRERVERTLALQPVDRVALHDQVSFNPGVIALYTGKRIDGYNYTVEDICEVIRKTLDACFPPVAPRGRKRVTDSEGFVVQHDNWTTWRVARPFAEDDVDSARDYVRRATERLCKLRFDAGPARQQFRDRMLKLQLLIGDTVIIDTSSHVGLCACWSRIGLPSFSFLYEDEPDVISEHLEASATNEIRRVHAIADPSLSPVILIADDFATKQGPIFSPAFLRKEHFPRLRRLTAAWHEHGLKVLYHSDGNWKSVIPDLVECGVDGFYCLEPAVGMDVVELKRTWPRHVWAGGVDGVDLMERGTPEQVRQEVRRHIEATDALRTGGLLVGTSSEVNPPIKPENYRAMVEAVGATLNRDFSGG
jgi:uroporphyrinogen decarboxylase